MDLGELGPERLITRKAIGSFSGLRFWDHWQAHRLYRFQKRKKEIGEGRSS